MTASPREYDNVDDSIASRKAPTPVPDIRDIDAIGAAHRQHGDAITRVLGLGLQLDRALFHLEEAGGRMAAAGSTRVEPDLPAPLAAYLNAWRSAQVGDAPLPLPVP